MGKLKKINDKFYLDIDEIVAIKQDYTLKKGLPFVVITVRSGAEFEVRGTVEEVYKEIFE